MQASLFLSTAALRQEKWLDQPPFHQYTQNFWIGGVHSNVMAFTLTLPTVHKDAH
jgi:hypothetical protein